MTDLCMAEGSHPHHHPPPPKKNLKNQRLVCISTRSLEFCPYNLYFGPPPSIYFLNWPMKSKQKTYLTIPAFHLPNKNKHFKTIIRTIHKTG